MHCTANPQGDTTLPTFFSGMLCTSLSYNLDTATLLITCHPLTLDTLSQHPRSYSIPGDLDYALDDMDAKDTAQYACLSQDNELKKYSEFARTLRERGVGHVKHDEAERNTFKISELTLHTLRLLTQLLLNSSYKEMHTQIRVFMDEVSKVLLPAATANVAAPTPDVYSVAMLGFNSLSVAPPESPSNSASSPSATS
jgi:hypothetical protein